MKPNVEKIFNYYYSPAYEAKKTLNDTAIFYKWILETADLSGLNALNVGGGSTPELHRSMKNRFKRLTGVDIDPVVLNNTDLDEGYVTDGLHLPFKDGQFDLIFSDWTVEHVKDPEVFLKEIYRVLKKGGALFIRTTNLRHYVSLVAVCTPFWFHRIVAQKLGRAYASSATFYKMNSPGKIKKLLQAVGFSEFQMQMVEGYPYYLDFNPVTFFLGVLYERLVNSFNFLSGFRLVIIVKAVK